MRPRLFGIGDWHHQQEAGRKPGGGDAAAEGLHRAAAALLDTVEERMLRNRFGL